MYYVGNVPYSSITGMPGPSLPLYNFSDDWQAHLNDAGLGGEWTGPDWVVTAINKLRSLIGTPLLNEQGKNSAAADLTRSNIQQFELDKANGTNNSGMSDKPYGASSSSGEPLIRLLILSTIVLVVVNIFRK